MEYDRAGLLALADEFERFPDRYPDCTGAGWTTVDVFLCFVAMMAIWNLCATDFYARPIVRSSTQLANECTTGSCTDRRPAAAAAESRPACWRSEIALSSGIDLSHRL